MHSLRLTLVALSCSLLLHAAMPAPRTVDARTAGMNRVALPMDPAGMAAHEPMRIGSPTSSAPSPGFSPIATTTLTADERELVEWVYARFASVGMELPDVDISFHDDTEACGGVHGRFRGSADERIVLVCVRDAGTFATRLERQRTLVHELAHAWDHATLDDEARRFLLPVVDAHDWYAADADWDERGVERFAETIVWGLYDQLRRPVLIDVTCDELHADFRMITGNTAPGPLERACHLVPSRFKSNNHM